MTGERKELFPEKVSAGSRTYFFDVKESADGIKYIRLTIKELLKTYEHHTTERI